MSFGVLTPEMRRIVQKHIQNKVVLDLGCGDSALSRVLLEEGARQILGVDKLPQAPISRLFEEGPGHLLYDVLFVSWPVNNYSSDFIPIWMGRASTVIYLGHNDDITCCGTPSLFWAFLHREAISVVEHHENDMLVLGASRCIPRAPTGVERKMLMDNLHRLPAQCRVLVQSSEVESAR